LPIDDRSRRILSSDERVSDLTPLQSDLAHMAPILLPPDARALTLEVVHEQLTVRVYLHGPGSLGRWADLDEVLTPFVERRLPAEQNWSVIVQAVRQDRPSPLEVFGQVIWIEDGSVVARQDGRAVEEGE
jgi:hypothetical protein